MLFHSVSIFNVIEDSKGRLRDVIRQLPPSELADEKLPEKIIEPFLLEIPTLNETNKYATTGEVDVDVSRDPQRFITDRSKPFYICGTEVTVSIPFQGDPRVFEVQPSQFNLNPPFGDVHNHELRLVYRIVDPAKNINAELERTISQVKQHLDWLRPSAEQMKRDLLQLAQSLITQRRQQTAAHAQIVSGLGIPIRQAQPASAQAATARVGAREYSGASVKRKPSEEWDVFISHASEDKDAIARPLAEALRAKGLSVWYDEFSLTVGDSLRRKIDEGLSNSRFGVVILSQHFFEKHWPEQELNGLATREVDGKKVILPVWHRVGFNDVRQYSPTLADRLAVTTDKGLEYVVERLLEVMK